MMGRHAKWLYVVEIAIAMVIALLLIFSQILK